MRNIFCLSLMGLVLFGCGSNQIGTVSPSPTPGTTIAALEDNLTVAENLATKYKNLPVCSTVGFQTSGTLCSDPVVLAKLKVLDTQAYNAVKLAENTNDNFNIALQDIANFQAAIPSIATNTINTTH